MNRRDFFGMSTVMAITSANLVSCAGDSNAVPSTEASTHTGPVTAFFEFRIAGPENQNMLDAVDALSSSLSTNTDFLGIALKNTVGDSTMTKNYPDSLKGVFTNSL